ncbi:NADPH-dependent FMN reductase [Membranihabitans maritimus]|uniref:NADPH-dependent FMN reductase n=1 Tax=Membranihabitans maritimus TaxID=2904244 RepID=UPI001F261806|nr:NAD(P)H-dependent oxidoreductase [Membranihabitans maritimus]
MTNYLIISSSIRTNRLSHRVALFFENYIQENDLGTSEIFDLDKADFPLFDERLSNKKNPSDKMLQFSEDVQKNDAIIIVTPEYNGGYPASLKNAIDLLYPEWYKKPTAIATVSDGNFGGTQVIYSLQFSLWKMRAWVVPVRFPVPNVDKAYSENGVPSNPKLSNNKAKVLFEELDWAVEAKKRMAD